MLQNIHPYQLATRSVPKGKKAKKATPPPTDHVIVIDCSGSMWDDLPRIRQQLKQKLPHLVEVDDTVSIVWFSGRGQYGVLLEREAVAGLTDLDRINKAIDRWLRPVGLTGFKEPLDEVATLAGKIADEQSGRVVNLLFLTDGWDNQWSRQQIIDAVDRVGGNVAAATFVEYGYYCNHPLMVEMAEKAGGSLIFSEDFRRYEPTFESVMGKRPTSAKKVEVNLETDAVANFAFAIHENELLTFSVQNQRISVPEYVDEVCWVIGPREGGGVEAIDPSPEVYAALAMYAQRMQPDVVYAILRALGDVSFIKEFSGCFGKQRYASFVDTATKAVFDENERFVEGRDPNAVPDDDATTVLDVLRILSEDPGNRVLIEHDDFSYSRIGRAREKVGADLTDEEQKKLQELTAKLSKTRNASGIKKIQSEIDALVAGKTESLDIKLDKVPDGVAITNLVYNEKRPNISLQIRREGTVDLDGTDAPDPLPGKLPSFVWRNYTIVKDGLLNVSQLPVVLTEETVKKLRDFEIGELFAGKPSTLFLDSLPIINRRMVQETSAKVLFGLQYELQKARAAQKVFNHYHKDRFGDGHRTAKIAGTYGDEAANWLKEQGITDGGFNPKTKAAEAQDYYIGKELSVALKGLSSLPKVDDVKKKLGGKLTPSQALMAPFVEEIEEFLGSKVYANAKDQDKAFRQVLEDRQTQSKADVRRLLHQISQIRFSVIVGQTWFTEFSSLDENSLEIEVDGAKIKGTVEMKEVEIAI